MFLLFYVRDWSFLRTLKSLIHVHFLSFLSLSNIIVITLTSDLIPYTKLVSKLTLDRQERYDIYIG